MKEQINQNNALLQTRYWLAVHRIPGLGPLMVSKLLKKVGDISLLFTKNATQLREFCLSEKEISLLQTVNWTKVETDLAWAAAEHHTILTWEDPRYPLLLREISSAPLVLYVMGDPWLLQTPQIAIVGSRNPSITGKENAMQFAATLAVQGLTITSGLALGIDAASHQGALAANKKTIAVLGSGLERLYPSSHIGLAEKITHSGGALVSEYPPDSPPKAAHFPQRNRIISGLSRGVLVVEAGLSSGSLITAHYALEQNREVFAIPGSIHHPMAKGCHQLLRQGAKLVETVEDILEEILPASLSCPVPSSLFSEKHMTLPVAPECQALLALLGNEPTSIDTLTARSGLTPKAVSSMLLLLELQDYVSVTPSGYLKR